MDDIFHGCHGGGAQHCVNRDCPGASHPLFYCCEGSIDRCVMAGPMDRKAAPNLPMSHPLTCSWMSSPLIDPQHGL